MKIEICNNTKEITQWIVVIIGLVILSSQLSSCTKHVNTQSTIVTKARFEAGIIGAYERRPHE